MFQTNSWKGFLPEILSIIQSQLGFSYTFVDSIDGIPGIMAADGNWTGLMGMLQRREIDFSLMGNTMIPQRALVPVVI